MNTVLDKAYVVLVRTRRHSIGHLLHRAMEADHDAGSDLGKSLFALPVQAKTGYTGPLKSVFLPRKNAIKIHRAGRVGAAPLIDENRSENFVLGQNDR
jgi:hypothetical protein